MSCDDLITTEALQNANLDVITLAEVTNSREGGVASGARIDTATNRFGTTTDTVDGAFKKMTSVPINGGVWAAGVTFNAYNEYMIYSGVAYKPKAATALPYESTATPDVASVEPFTVGVGSDQIGQYSDYVCGSVASAKAGSTIGGGVITQSSIDNNNISVSTQGYSGAWSVLINPVGAENYIATTRQRVRDTLSDPAWEPDGHGDHYMFGGTTYVLMLQLSNKSTIESFGAVGDSDGTAGSGTDCTAAVQAMADRGVPIKVPVGRYRITGQIDRGLATWIGERGRQTSLDPGSEIICDDSIYTADAFIRAPLEMRNLVISGTSKLGTGVAVENVNTATFLGWSRFENSRIRKFDLGLHVGNVFESSWFNIVIEDNIKGFDVKPFNDAADNGYFTTLHFDNLVVRENSQYGADIDPDLKSPNLALRNTNFENNGASGTYQLRMRNCDPFVWDNLYLENTPTVPAFLNAGGNVGTGEAVFVNNTGGLNLGTGTFGGEFQRVKMTAGVITASGGLNQTLNFSNSSILFSGGTPPSISSLTMSTTTADGTYYNRYEAGSGVNFQMGGSSKIAEIQPVSYTYAAGATIAGGSAATIASNVPLNNVMLKAAPSAAFRNLYNNKVQLLVTVATTNSEDFYSIIAYNLAGTSFTIPPNTIIDMVFIKSGN